MLPKTRNAIFFFLFGLSMLGKIISNSRDNMHEMSKPIFWKNKKNISKGRLLRNMHEMSKPIFWKNKKKKGRLLKQFAWNVKTIFLKKKKNK